MLSHHSRPASGEDTAENYIFSSRVPAWTGPACVVPAKTSSRTFFFILQLQQVIARHNPVTPDLRHGQATTFRKIFLSHG
jgi:hypothetical protein